MSFIPFLYVCTLQYAVSLTVNSFLFFLPVCLHFPHLEEELYFNFLCSLSLACIVSVRLTVLFDSHTCLLDSNSPVCPCLCVLQSTSLVSWATVPLTASGTVNSSPSIPLICECTWSLFAMEQTQRFTKLKWALILLGSFYPPYSHGRYSRTDFAWIFLLDLPSI